MTFAHSYHFQWPFLKYFFPFCFRLEKVSGQSDKNRKNIRKIDGNLDRLRKFVESDFKSVSEEAEDIKKRALKADKQKDQAEKKREDAEKERSRAEAEKEKALEDAKLADGALKKASDERDACKMEAESAWIQVRDGFSFNRQ